MFNSSTSKKTTTQTFADTIDARIGVDSMTGGNIVGQGATVGGSGITTSIGDMAKVTQKYLGDITLGLSGSDLSTILGQQAEANAQSTMSILDTATGRIESIASNALGTVGAVSTGGEPVDWTRYIPLIVIGVIALAASRGRHG